MRYFFIALVLFAGAVVAVPSLREEVMPTVQGKLNSIPSGNGKTLIAAGETGHFGIVFFPLVT
jgi:hypothetical protein